MFPTFQNNIWKEKYKIHQAMQQENTSTHNKFNLCMDLSRSSSADVSFDLGQQQT